MKSNRLTNRVSNNMIAYKLSEDSDHFLYIKNDNKYWKIVDKLTMLESAIEQVSFERDIAILQLEELGYSLGERIKDKDKVCANCDLGLKPSDCTEYEHYECEFRSRTKKQAESQSNMEFFKSTVNKMSTDEIKSAINYLVEAISDRKAV